MDIFGLSDIPTSNPTDTDFSWYTFTLLEINKNLKKGVGITKKVRKQVAS